MIKSKLFLVAVVLCLMTGFTAMVGVNNSSATKSVKAGDVLVLSATDQLCWSDSCSYWTYSYTGDPSNCVGGGYWKTTYNGSAKPIQAGKYLISHNAGFDSLSYWSGFTTGSNGDTLCYSQQCSHPAACTQPGSEDWVKNQWGVMAGGGLDAKYETVPGQPYFIAYWDYFSDGVIDSTARSVVVSLADTTATFTPNEVWICNHPWPYWGNFFGDGFARPLNQPGDYFVLRITGYNGDAACGTVTDTLAIYDPTVQYGVRQNPKWHKVDLADEFGCALTSLSFTMKSTDERIIDGVNYDPNTAVYFDMDKLQVEVTGKASAKPVARKAPAPNASKAKAIEVTDYFPLTSYTGGDAVVYDAKGKEVWRTTVKAGEKINLSKLPKGDYRLRHGHRAIPFKKAN